MTTGDLKGDRINGAYSQLRISGLTVSATPEDSALALDRLETMAAEFEGRNICVEYNFEDEPDPGSTHNLERKYWHAFDTNLAVRLLADFGKGMQPDPVLISQAQQGFSFLSATTAPKRQTQYPSRMPRGSGSTRLNRWNRYFQPAAEVPLSSSSVTLFIGDVDDFTEEFNSWLINSETIDAYTIEADTGLTIESSLISDDFNAVNYRITATGNSDTNSNTKLTVTIKATSDNGRATTRIKNFELLEA
jgi:hypothetical protein